MKCPACHYERDYDYIDNKSIGDEDFIYIKGNFAVRKFGRDEFVQLYACPKCNCIILKDTEKDENRNV